jgi:hypothetical protein
VNGSRDTTLPSEHDGQHYEELMYEAADASSSPNATPKKAGLATSSLRFLSQPAELLNQQLAWVCSILRPDLIVTNAQ